MLFILFNCTMFIRGYLDAQISVGRGLVAVILWFVFLPWVEPGDEFVNEEPVEYAYEDQAFDNSENLAGKMTAPRNHFYLCFASCTFYCHAALPIICYIMPPILPCQPLTILS